MVASVHRAVVDLISRGDLDITISHVAHEAGVNPTSIYRRWGTRDQLVLDATAAHLRRNSPTPDTGSLRGDLVDWVVEIEHNLVTPEGRALLRTLATAEDHPGHARDVLHHFGDVTTVLDRAQQRGEVPPTPEQVLDRVLAPLTLRTLLGLAVPDGYGRHLVEELLASVPQQC
ncbi:TetR/AcrR family transcriptional regulator [Prauserella flavalba]|uniref:TetR/AcrR family transcriptional regulator n=1 Tax=Prauserella flavalba TaxID=1477506 RepID=UPI0036EAB32E